MENISNNKKTLLDQAIKSHQQGLLSEAEALYNNYLSKHPDDPDALHLSGVLNIQLKKIPEGIDRIKNAIKQRKDFPKALSNLGRILCDIGDNKSGSLAYSQSIRLDNKNELVWNSLAISFFNDQNYSAAINTINEAIKLHPFSESLYDNGCRILKRENKINECYLLAKKGLMKIPGNSRLRMHYAQCCFILNKFDDAWKDYEVRLIAEENPNQKPAYPFTVWQGESLRDKSILVWTEQGPGEIFLCSSMIDKIINLSKNCLIITSKRFITILQRSFPNAEVIDGENFSSENQNIDYQSPTMSLGRYLIRELSDIESCQGKILPNSEITNMLRKKYQSRAPDTKLVGISWKSLESVYSDNKNISINELIPILKIPNLTFINLQYGINEKEMREIENNDIKFINDKNIDPINNLDDHIAQVAAMDFVITTSNTTAHTAGVIGIKTFCLLPHTLGEGLFWYWFTDINNSPWYPNTSLYRQKYHNEWSLPLGKLTNDLIRHLNAVNSLDEPEEIAKDLSEIFLKKNQIIPAGILASLSINHGKKDISLFRTLASSKVLQSEFSQALKILNQALRLHKDNTDLLIDKANTLTNLRKYHKASRVLAEANNIEKEKFIILNNLALSKRREGKTLEALDILKQIKSPPDNKASIYLSIASCLSETGDFEKAEKIYYELIHRDNEALKAKTSLGMHYLKNKKLKKGWPLLKSRLNLETANINYNNFPFETWNQQEVNNKNILVWTEQGIGEEILISTMIDDLMIKAKSITLLCSKRMVPLYKRSFRKINVIERKEPLPSQALDNSIDYQMSLSDLGLHLRPDIKNFLNKPKPPLKSNNVLKEKLRKKYQILTNSKFLIGISWNSQTPNIGKLKSIKPKYFSILLEDKRPSLISLQYNPLENHIKEMKEIFGKNFFHDKTIDPLINLDHSASQIAAMDLVVTISNTTAHLAGALGIPTALLVPKGTGRHWYWFNGLKQSPWYNSIEIFECDNDYDWSKPIKLIQNKINEIIN